MVTLDVKELKKVYTPIDHIAKRFDDLWHEQKIQAGQMREIEKRLNKLEQRLDKIEARLDNMEKLLLLICKKLEINPTV